MNLPAFPLLEYSVRVEDCMASLSQYTNDLCRTEFLGEDFLDFLEITGEAKEILEIENKLMLDQHSTFYTPPI